MGLQSTRLDFGADLSSLEISVEQGPDFPAGIPVKNIAKITMNISCLE